MNLNQLFRKKSVEQILQKMEETNLSNPGSKLSKHLGVKDLTAFGIAAIIGAGIFSTIGQASADGGPGVIFLFIFTAVACGFSAFAYAEFASMVPVSGSAYTYSYVAFGELTAWIIGWALIMEYGIGNITVAISWSDYFTGLLHSCGLQMPTWMTMDYLTAHQGFMEAQKLMGTGTTLNSLTPALRDAFTAYSSAPIIAGLPIVADVPALGIIIFITWLVYKGIRESRNAANVMVVIKLAIVLMIIAVGVFYVDTDNWSPFAPNGLGGILKGVSAVFFAYIGFDAISTTAEECKNPQRDLPKGMMWSIIICTVLYIAIALILTGMVSYKELAVGDPLAFVFQKHHLKWLSGIIAVSAVIAMASVLLVFQLGQPRIWMSMSRDGLLPAIFSRIHPKYHTPSFATIVTGFIVGVPALFMNLTMVTNLCSIGTLFAFVLVCAGVMKLQNDSTAPRGSFKTPYLNSKFIFGPLFIIGIVMIWNYKNDAFIDFIKSREIKSHSEILSALNDQEKQQLQVDLQKLNKSELNLQQLIIENIDNKEFKKMMRNASKVDDKIYTVNLANFSRNIPMWIFLLISFLMIFWSFTKNLSLIPLLGFESCLYMMAEIELENWIGFFIWLIAGLLIYFSYGYKNSKLNLTSSETKA